MTVGEGLAVYLSIGVLCVLAYILRVRLVEPYLRRKPLGARAQAVKAAKILFLWPLLFFLVDPD